MKSRKVQWLTHPSDLPSRFLSQPFEKVRTEDCGVNTVVDFESKVGVRLHSRVETHQ